MIWLKLPPTANRLVRPARVGRHVRLVKTRGARSWVRYAQMQLRASGLRPMAGPLKFQVHLQVHRITSDLSNRIKQLEDAVTGIGWHDDCQVVELSVTKRVVEATVEECVGVEILLAKTDPLTGGRIERAKKAGGLR